MAFSRLEKIGNIYTRVTGLLRAGAMKWEDRPLFYDIYTAFPPIKENVYMEEAPKIKVREIFYAEDQERATRDYTNMLAFDMNEKKPKRFDRQKFIDKQHISTTKAQQTEDIGSKEKLFDVQNLDLKKD
ncbi:hypothetical protein PVAND_009946 [Polypedilum vanderplanki]|uniref:Small ribosomal subunit protein mS23 conserved domain-containing protein n=1 Tax=Polypedilum vanderplanki TaxID=319348 RepID=A0A9J6CFQ1_POLVA|nr:hypothetical protein PVAND_009946 [Polypedilum vanderplanki]